MKGLKKFSLLALGLLFVAGVASCNNKSANNDDNKGQQVDPGTDPGTGPDPIDPPVPPVPPLPPADADGDGVPDEYVEMEDLDAEIGDLSTLEQPENYPGTYINEENKLQYRLSELNAYTNSNTERKDLARTKFYLGEEFNYDNLLVIATFYKINEDGSDAKDEYGRVVPVRARVTNFQVDSSEIDTSVMGNYYAQVNYRYGETVKTVSYSVSVRSSEFETTSNLQYIAGIKAGYNSDVNSDIFKLKNDGRIATTYVQVSGENTFNLDVSQLNVQLVKNTVNGVASAFTTEFIDYDISSFTNDTANKIIYNADNTFKLDYSSVNTGEVGTYLVPITYKAENIVIGDRTIENVVKAFIVVDVIAPVTQIMNTNTFTVEASMGLPDFSNYSVLVVRKALDGEDEDTIVEMLNITNDLFRYENFIAYQKGNQANAKFILKETTEEGEEVSFVSPVTVTESSTYNIKIVSDMTGGTIVDTSGSAGSKQYYTEYDLGNGVKAYNVQYTDSSGKDTIGSKARTCNSDGLTFTGFVGLDSIAKNSYFEFTFTTDTVLILYVGSYSAENRDVVVYDESGEEVLSETVFISDCVNAQSSDGKQSPQRIVLNLSAGTYKVAAAGSQLTFHGYIIGTLK